MQNKLSGLSLSFRWNPVKVSPAKCFPRSRCRHASCLHNEYIYIVGGKDAHISLKDVWRYHIGNLVWEKVIFQGDELPYLEGHSLVSRNRLLLLFGGTFGDDLTDSALWILNPDLKHIRKFHCDVGAPQPCTRRHHSAVIHDNAMYIYGGHIDLKGSTSEFWAFHIDEEEWELKIPQYKRSDSPSGRHGHTAVMYGRDMWIYGGMSDLTPKSDFWYYNFHVQKWARLKTKFGPPPLVGHSAVVVKDCMIMFGGERENVMISDLWIFSFTNLRWSQIQLSSVTPSPRMWHSLLVVTSITNKGDNSARTHSLPYLQNKGPTTRQRRPKTSPAYASARNRVTPKVQRKDLQNSEGSDSKLERPNHLELVSVNSKTSLQPQIPVVMKTPQSKKDIEKSPLLDTRQLSNQSVCSDCSQSSLRGTDNPGLDISASLDKLSLINNAETLAGSSPSEEAVLKLGQSNNSQRYSKRGHNPISGGQAHLRLNDIHVPNLIKVKPYNPHSEKDLVIEDLESSCSSSFSRQSKGLSGPDFDKNKRNSLFRKRQLSQGNELNIIGGFTYDDFSMRKNRSSSMSGLYQSCSENTGISDRYSSVESLIKLHDSNSVHCWESEDGDSPVSNVTENRRVPGHDDVGTPNSVSMETTSFSVAATTTQHSSQNQAPYADQHIIINKDAEAHRVLTNQAKNRNGTRKKESSNSENIVPFLLLFGGKEFKGGNGRTEPLPVWKCDIFMRHSDITHGEFHKSSLVI